MSIFHELVRCHEDFEHFCRNHVSLPIRGMNVTPEDRIAEHAPNRALMSPHAYQLRYIKHIEKNRLSMAIKFRNSGLTTFSVVYALWRVMFHENQHILFVAKTRNEAQHLAKITTQVIDGFKRVMSPVWWAQNSMVADDRHFLGTDSRLRFGIMSDARGRALTHLFIDEAAFNKDVEKHLDSAMIAIGKEGKLIALSTTNGLGNWFQQTWCNALVGQNSYTNFGCSHTEHPFYQQAENVERLKKNLGTEGWMQEVLGQFVVMPEKPGNTNQSKQFALSTLRSLHSTSSLNDVEKHALQKAIEALAI